MSTAESWGGGGHTHTERLSQQDDSRDVFVETVTHVTQMNVLLLGVDGSDSHGEGMIVFKNLI